MNNQYEVLSPWAEADPVPIKGILPRVTDLSGKKIGLFTNAKAVAPLILTVVEQKLKERFPTCETSWYHGKRQGLPEKGEEKVKFEEWLKGVDTVILGVGD
jgi:hypothetical protein